MWESQLDHWEREPTPTSSAATLQLPLPSLLPGILINKLSSTYLLFCLTSFLENPPSAVGSLIPSAKSVNSQHSGSSRYFSNLNKFCDSCNGRLIHFRRIFKFLTSTKQLNLFVTKCSQRKLIVINLFYLWP